MESHLKKVIVGIMLIGILVFLKYDIVSAITIYDVPLEYDLQVYINELCESYEVPYDIVISLIKHESTYQEDVISSTNDYGLMQINKSNHYWITRDIGISDYLDAYENVEAGVYMLSIYYNLYEDSHKALMAYNMSAAKAKQLWQKGILTSSYSSNIINYTEDLKELVVECMIE